MKKHRYTPEVEQLQPENDGLEDDFPFPRGVFSGSMLILWGVTIILMYMHTCRYAGQEYACMRVKAIHRLYCKSLFPYLVL